MAEPTVLLVADEARLRSRVKSALEKRGYHVLAARSSFEAFATAAGHPVDALVTKVDLPGVEGSALGRILCDTFPGLPVVYLAKVNEEGADRLTQPGDVADQLDRLITQRSRRKPASIDRGQGGRHSRSA